MILVTGTPGWLGNRFIEILAGEVKELPESKSYPVADKIRCLCLPHINTSFLSDYAEQVEVVRGDIRDKNSLKDFFKDSEGATLYHLAGIIHPDRGVKQFYEVNVEGTINILEMAKELRVGKILTMSSNSQSGCNPNVDHVFTEESPYNPYLNYGKSKMLMEQAAMKYYNMYDMDITIIRTCWFYGPHQPERQTEFFMMIKEGRFPIIGAGTNRRSMSYVDNICQGMLLTANNSITKGKTYWIADDRPYTMNEIVDTVEDVLEKDFGYQVKHKRLRLPNIIGSIAYATDMTIQGAGSYNKKVHVLSELNKNISCAVDLAKKEIGYDPEISLRDGMRRSIEWCLRKGLKI